MEGFVCVACQCVKHFGYDDNDNGSGSGSGSGSGDDIGDRHKDPFSDDTSTDPSGEGDATTTAALLGVPAALPTGATLIVMPETLIGQWRGEVAKHFHASVDVKRDGSPTRTRVTSSSSSSSLSSSSSSSSSPHAHHQPEPPLRIFEYQGSDWKTLSSQGQSVSHSVS